MAIDDFEIVTTSAGVLSIRNKIVGEIMHNPVGPWQEANSLYVDQSGLRSQLLQCQSRPLTLFDVGLGSASNAVAAIDAALKCETDQTRRQLHIVSFENNLDLLRFTLFHAEKFPHLERYQGALKSILEARHWKSPCHSVQWDLREGDFLKTIDEEACCPDIIYYDPYSPNVGQDMWTLSSFTKLRKKCAAPNGNFTTNVYTYSVSTPIRAALLLAGFYVGSGLPTGLKEETTEASTSLGGLKSPLGKEWFGRWTRSHKKLPYDAEADQEEALLAGIRAHQQFKNHVVTF
jgi:queuine tRNA-ribosyltransferase